MAILFSRGVLPEGWPVEVEVVTDPSADPTLKGAKGDKGDTGPTGAAGATGSQGAVGPAGATLVGTVTLAQTATVAIALGIREVTVALAGTVKGGRYLAFCDSYRLNGAASVVGRPAGYALIDAVCNTAGQITISLNAPLLAIGNSYALTCSVVRINA
ncbi:collagen-like protein [Sphingomonas sp. 1P06PA]|uniref:collagen-like triple helix repeat-containing protein n=1 Tax=Sphingomonas sp. 1P06PA TaxID=554121 RepID=UPI0039A46F9E